MPPHQADLDAGTLRNSAGFDVDLAPSKAATGEALAAAPSDTAIAALRDASSEKSAAGPPSAPAWSVLSLLARYWRAFHDRRRRERLRASLYGLSERELMDIGLTPGDINYIVAYRAFEKRRNGATDPWLSRGLM